LPSWNARTLKRRHISWCTLYHFAVLTYYKLEEFVPGLGSHISASDVCELLVTKLLIFLRSWHLLYEERTFMQCPFQSINYISHFSKKHWCGPESVNYLLNCYCVIRWYYGPSTWISLSDLVLFCFSIRKYDIKNQFTWSSTWFIYIFKCCGLVDFWL
jgi:hypothetical protein